MNKENETRIMDIAGMAVFGLLGIVALIVGCCGCKHQFMIATMCAIMVVALLIDYKHTKTK